MERGAFQMGFWLRIGQRCDVSLALVIGSAACVYEDLAGVYSLLDGVRPAYILSVNDFACQWAGYEAWDSSLDAFVTFHAEKLAGWRNKRIELGLPEPGVWITAPRRPLPDFPVETVPNWGGSSAFLAVSAAINHFGADKIIVAGVPLCYKTSHFDKPKPFTAAGTYRRGWLTQKKLLDGRLKSMSGWTAEQYGMPSREWINGHN